MGDSCNTPITPQNLFSSQFKRPNLHGPLETFADPNTPVHSALTNIHHPKPKLMNYGRLNNSFRNHSLKDHAEQRSCNVQPFIMNIQCDCVSMTEEQLFDTNVSKDYDNLNDAVEDILRNKKCSSQLGCDKKRRMRLTQE